MKKLLDTEEIGDWMSSQYYRDLKKLALMVSDEFVLTLWKIYLPVDVQLVLAAATDSKPGALMELADRSIRLERTHPELQRSGSYANEYEALEQANDRLGATMR